MPRSTLTRAKACGWVPGGAAFPYQGPSAGETVPSASSGCGSGPASSLEVRAKVEVQVGTWLRRRLSLKGRAEVFAVHIFPLILYRLSVLPLPKDHQAALIQSLFKLLWKGGSPLVRRQVCYQRPCDGGLGMPDLESHRLAETGLPGPIVDVGRGVEPQAWSCLPWPGVVSQGWRPSDKPPFVVECRGALRNLPRSSDLSWTRKELYRGLVVWSGSSGRRGRFAQSGIGHQVRASWATPSPRSPGG